MNSAGTPQFKPASVSIATSIETTYCQHSFLHESPYVSTDAFMALTVRNGSAAPSP